VAGMTGGKSRMRGRGPGYASLGTARGRGIGEDRLLRNMDLKGLRGVINSNYLV
jgi:hypothetical protein